MEPMELPVSLLPSNPSEVFIDSSYFMQSNPSPLPSPANIRQLATAAGEQNWSRPAPVKFQNLGLIVKFGSGISIAEGQCLWALQHLLRGKVPVPEVYAWRTDGDMVFLYMQLVGGTTLEKRWESLDSDERLGICEQLRSMVDVLRQL